MDTFSLRLFAIFASCGFLSHVLYFIRGEHHKNALLFIKSLFWGMIVAELVLIHVWNVAFDTAAKFIALSLAAFFSSLWTSMFVYRVAFHPLGHFPGPSLAKISKFYVFFKVRRADSFRRLYHWHEKYGNFVRTGPNELSIVSPNAAAIILGPRSQCMKSPWYDYVVGQSLESLHSTRDVATHEARRRVWDWGFSMTALRNYEARVTTYTHELVSQISSFSGTPVDVSAWFNYYSFDVMGDLAFGKSFNMLKSGQSHFAIDWLERSAHLLGFCSPVSWLIPVGAAAPIVGTEFRRFIKWCNQQIDERREMKVQVPDITSWLLKAAKDRNDREATKWLHGDARLIIVAGSDTLAISLTHIFYHLATDPAQVKKLRKELEPLMKPDEPFNVKNVQYAEHMNGVINEALRLHPPVPSGIFRTTPAQGVTIDEVYVPGGVNLVVPFYVIGRSEECFTRPHEFIPERWSSQPELVKNKNGFAPFSLGPFGCIGQKLAMMEMKTVIALLISRFDVKLADGEDGSELLEKSTDAFTMRMKALKLVFMERKAGEEDSD